MAKTKHKPADLDERDRVVLLAMMLDSDSDDIEYAENLPIPWQFMADRQKSASVKLREQADLILRARRLVAAHYRCGSDNCAHWDDLRNALNV